MSTVEKQYFHTLAIFWQSKHLSIELQLLVQSGYITTNVEVYSIQHCVIKFVSDVRQVCCFLRVLRIPPPVYTTLLKKKIINDGFSYSENA
jgi:hypothetical protein